MLIAIATTTAIVIVVVDVVVALLVLLLGGDDDGAGESLGCLVAWRSYCVSLIVRQLCPPPRPCLALSLSPLSPFLEA